MLGLKGEGEGSTSNIDKHFPIGLCPPCGQTVRVSYLYTPWENILD